MHDSSDLGVNRTLDMITAKYYWPGLTHDVKEYVSCLVNKVYTIELAFVHLATNIYMYMTIMLCSTLPDKYGAYVEEEPWFDSERQGCP